MAADRDRLIKESQNTKLRDELENFMHNAIGRPKKPTTWMNT